MPRTQSLSQSKTAPNASLQAGMLQRKCACGNHTVAGSECAACGKDRQLLQRATRDSEPETQGSAGVPAIVHEVLRSPGQPLDAANRAFFEPRLGQNFSLVPVAQAAASTNLIIGRADDKFELEAEHASSRMLSDLEPRTNDAHADLKPVRLHTGARAAEAAQSVNARAFTVGRDIFFDAGEYDPHTSSGRQLLAHELAHVFQPSGDRIATTLRRVPAKAAKKQPGVTFWFSVQVTTELTSDQLLLEFIRQYYGLSTLAEAAKRRDERKWGWTGTPHAVGPADVKKKYVLIQITDHSLQPQDAKSRAESKKQFQQMAPEDQSAINAEADREFREKTKYKPGGKLGNSPDDAKMAQYWIAIRDQLLRQRKEIDSLPPALKKFLFTEDAPRAVEPADYSTLLRIARKLANLSDSELEDYKSKVNALTSNWSAFESSIDKYVSGRTQRGEEGKDREKKKTRIYGLEEVYQKYKTYRSLQSSAESTPSIDEFGVADPNREYADSLVQNAESELIANLKRFGFSSIGEFETAIRDYEAAFEKESIAIAYDMLAKYEHVLYEEEKKYQNPANAAALAEALGKTQAKAHFEEAATQKAIASAFMPDPDIHRYLPGDLELKQKHQKKSAEARSAAESEVTTAAADPLISEKDFNLERLAQADASEVQSIMLGYIRTRRENIQETRDNLNSDPGLIYRLDELMKASFESQRIKSGTIYDLVIRDKIHDEKMGRIIPKIVLAIIGIVAGLLSFGTGTVAVAAAATAFGVSAFQAVEAFREYEVADAAHGAKLLSEDPSFGWVIVAIVGAGIDLGVAVAAVKAIAPAVDAFNATGDIIKLEKELDALVEAGKIEEQVRASVVKATAAEKEYRAAVKEFRGALFQANIFVGGTPALAEFVKVVYYAAKRGIVSFERFVLQLKADKLLGEAGLEAEQLTQLKVAFQEATSAADDLATHGKTLSMSEEQVTAFVELWAKSKGSTLDQIKGQMGLWAATKQSGIPFGFESLEKFALFKAAAAKGLKKAKYSDAEAILQGSAVSGISFEKKIPFGAHSDLDVAIASRSLLEKARKAGFPVVGNPMRIGPLKHGQIAELDLGSMQRALEEAADGRTVNFLLFGNRDAALKSIRGLNPESIPLK